MSHQINRFQIQTIIFLLKKVFWILVLFSCMGCSRKPDNFTNSIIMNFVRIESGSFFMGALNPTSQIQLNGPEYLTQGNWDEHPVHSVKISRPFYLSKTEVTIEQYRQFRPDYQGSEDYSPYASGVSWYDAQDFCEWLSNKEGKPYRLPTEAEWEYACRAGTTSLFSSGDMPPEPETPNAWGLNNMHSGVIEWCYDNYGKYSEKDQVDPIGLEYGQTKVVRGGGLDKENSTFYARAANRASMAPSFKIFQKVSESKEAMSEAGEKEHFKLESGLGGTWFGESDFTEPRGQHILSEINYDWGKGFEGESYWSARWCGAIEAPFTGEVTFHAEVDDRLTLKIDGKTVSSGRGDTAGNVSLSLIKGVKYPVVLSYSQSGGPAYLRLYWSWPGQNKTLVTAEALSFTPEDVKKTVPRVKPPGHHPIGFRVVQAPIPNSTPLPYMAPFVQQCVKQNTAVSQYGPDPDKPYFRKRYLLPVPPDNSSREEIDAVGMHPLFRGHNHSPALEVCANGDVMTIIYTSYREYEPGVSLMATRLRFGAGQWDMPCPLFDFVDVNDHAPMLWNDDGTIHFFWSNPRLDSAFPFQWTSSNNNGATWSLIKFPEFLNDVGDHSKQPINSAFRDKDDTIYIASDGKGPESVLWASRDNGNTWYDTKGRTNGRHTTYVLLKDGSILGMGGKNTDIDGYMPKSISHDGGKTWRIEKTPFSTLGSNQRPSIIRLKSGRLFFVSDFQRTSDCYQPEDIKVKGALVAFSDDDGKTWHIKTLPGALPHETRECENPTVGYSVARQGPNGLIHVITTMNHPCLHFTFNEAWLLQPEDERFTDQVPPDPPRSEIPQVKRFEERFPNGKIRATWSAGTGENGQYHLHGTETWYYENGRKQWEVTYNRGRKIGQETYWSEDGHKVWSWNHQQDGTSIWIRWWPNGHKKSESTWRDGKCEGTAILWNPTGTINQQKVFRNGMTVGRILK